MDVLVEQFSDYRILRFFVPDFESLNLKEKQFAYCLQQAALSGRDILWDQNYKYNLLIRNVLEDIYLNFSGDKNSDIFNAFVIYLKKVWFSNGIHHHNSMDKFFPEMETREFIELFQKYSTGKYLLPESENFESFEEFIIDLMYNRERDAKRLSLDPTHDIIENSACNFYENISQKEAEDFYTVMQENGGEDAPSFGLNSKLIKSSDKINEKIWKMGGMYSDAISQIVFWLEKSLDFTCNDIQKHALQKLIEFYKSGNLTTFDEYSIDWVKDHESKIDVINGFIEVYGDPLGRKATYESVVSMLDEESTLRAKIISENAQWFENHSTTDIKFKKEEVRGVSARGIHVITAAGDTHPSMPIGINLPNADWIRAKHGSKSVTISNVIDAYDEVSKSSGALEEFAYSLQEIELSKKYGSLASKLHVDMHEIIGHGSGKLAEGVQDPANTLKNYASTIEEARADLVALYFAIDPKLVELGLMDTVEVGFAEYNSYIRGGLMTQLVRVELGKNIEESHQRNRQLIAKWVFENGKNENVIEIKNVQGKTYFVVNDHFRLRELFGKLLAEIQRIKSEGDYEAAKYLVETYGVKVDFLLHEEVLVRWKSLKIPTYSGFLNPVLKSVERNNEIVDVKLEYADDFVSQMMDYSKKYSFLKI